MTGRRSIANAAAWAALAAYAFVATAIIYRSVGDVTFGLWATIVAIRTFLLTLDSGLSFGVARDVASAGSDPASSAGVRAAQGLAIVVGAGVALLGIVFATVPGSLLGLTGQAAATSQFVTMLLSIEVAVTIAAGPMYSILRGLERFDVLAVANGGYAVVAVVALVLLIGPLGLVGAALAMLIGRIAALVAVLVWLSLQHRVFLWPSIAGVHVRRVARFAAPLWVVAVASRIGLGTDVLIVGAFFGPSPAGQYAVGAAIPAMAAGLLFALLDAAYPRLVRADGSGLQQNVSDLALTGSTLAGLGFTAIAMNASSLLLVWTGQVNDLGTTVAVVYSLAWAINIPAHILVLGLIARSGHTVLAPIVVGEAVASLSLSILMAAAGLPLGPALGTLITVTVSNLIILPALVFRRTTLSAAPFARSTAIGFAIGAATAVAINVVAAALVPDPLPKLVLVAVVTSGIGGLVVLRLRRVNSWSRMGLLVRHGGWWVLLRQWLEARRGRARLRHDRIVAPIIWHQSPAPLVTVRIATYNRGRLVAERAIASALAQTHERLEVVVVGDACDSATADAVLSVRDERVRFVNLPTRGPYPHNAQHRWMVAGAQPMNHGVAIARGEWIAPLDDDDEFTSDHIAVLLDAARSSDSEFVYGIAAMETEPGAWDAVGSWPLRRAQIIHAAVMYHRRLSFMNLDPQSWRVGEPADWNLWKRMRRAGARMSFVEAVVARHYLEARELG